MVCATEDTQSVKGAKIAALWECNNPHGKILRHHEEAQAKLIDGALDLGTKDMTSPHTRAGTTPTATRTAKVTQATPVASSRRHWLCWTPSQPATRLSDYCTKTCPASLHHSVPEFRKPAAHPRGAAPRPRVIMVRRRRVATRFADTPGESSGGGGGP